MGAALIRAFGAAGTQVTVWNRTRSKAEALAGPMVTVVETPQEAIDANACCILNLTNYPPAEKLLDRDLGGKAILQLTTGKPSEARRLGERVEGRGGRYLDGAIMGFPGHVGTSNNMVLYSGNAALFQEVEPLLGQIGSSMFLGEDPGWASALDLGALMPVVAMTVGLLQGIRSCRQEEIPDQVYDDFIRQMVPAVLEDTLGKARREGFDVDPSQAESSISLMASATRLFADYCEEAQIDPSLFDAISRLFTAGVNSGHGDYDWVYASQIQITE